MSQEALDSLEQARLSTLREQRKCAWCGRKFKSSDELADHVMINHTLQALKDRVARVITESEALNKELDSLTTVIQLYAEVMEKLRDLRPVRDAG